MLTDLTSVAIIILAFEAMLCLIIPLALTIGIAYLLVRTRRFLPPKFRLARLQAQRVNEAVDRAGAKLTGSLAEAEARYTRTDTLLRSLFRSTKKDQL
jgi:hypothetical protein